MKWEIRSDQMWLLLILESWMKICLYAWFGVAPKINHRENNNKKFNVPHWFIKIIFCSSTNFDKRKK